MTIEDPATARLYWLLAVHPGAEFTAEPLSAALDTSIADVERGLAQLLNANLVSEVSEERYRLHDLLREHAESTAEQHDDHHSQQAALRRMVEWYMRRTAAADMVLNPFPRRLSSVYEDNDTTFFPDPEAALNWFDTERTNIVASHQLASHHGWDELVFQFAEAMWNPLRVSRAFDELVTTQQLGADAAGRSQNLLEAVCLVRVAFGETSRGRHGAAITASTTALQRATALKDQWAQAAALSTRARAFLAADNPRAALDDLTKALNIDEERADPRSIALRYRRIGNAHAHPTIAEYDKAIEYLQVAATMLRSIGDEIGYARTIIDLAETRLHADQYTIALTELHDIVDIVRSYGSVGYLGQVYTVMGRAHDHLGHAADAEHCYSIAIEFYTAAGPGAAPKRHALPHLRNKLKHQLD